MSSGPFTLTTYQAEYDAAQIHPIKVQPETLGLVIAGEANTAPVGAVTSPISASVSKGKRGIGLGAARVSVRFTGGAPAGYEEGSAIRLPLLNADIRAVATRAAVGTYLANAIVVVSNYSGESVG